MQSKKEALHRRDFLKVSTASTATAFGAFALAGNQSAMAATQSTDSGSMMAMASLSEDEIAALPRVKQELVAPPFLPEHEQVASGGPKVVEITMTCEDIRWTVDDSGAELWAMTFNGSVPGPLVVCHQDDYVELTLKNPSANTMEHNIDFHASTGALGGGALTHVAPGQETVLRFRATKAGVYIYHCAPGGQMIPYHVVHGMNGAVMVLPRDGLNDGKGNPLRYDRAYYIGEQDFYIPKDENGNWKTYGGPAHKLRRRLSGHAFSHPDPHRVQRQGRCAYGRRSNEGEGRRVGAVHPLPGQPRFAPAPHRRSRGLCLGDGLLRRRPGDGAGDLVHPRGFRGRGPCTPSINRVCTCISTTTSSKRSNSVPPRTWSWRAIGMTTS